MPTIMECAELAHRSYKIAGGTTVQRGVGAVGLRQQQTMFGNWALVHEIDNPHPHRFWGKGESGALVLQIWKKGDRYIVATRGTDATNVHDVLADLQIGLHSHFVLPKYHSRGARARDAFADWHGAQATAPASVTFTGHSLGGNLAQLLAIEYRGARSNFVTFNSPGCNTRCSSKGWTNFGINVCVDNDIVRRTGGKNLGVKYLMKSQFGKFAAHKMDNLIAMLRHDPIAQMSVRQAILYAERAVQIADPNDRWRLPKIL